MLVSAFDSANLLDRVQRLARVSQLAFGGACCERLLPNYRAFQTTANWGNVTVLRNALDFVWASIPTGQVSPAEVQIHIQKCEAMAPSSNDFDVLLVTAAQDACFSVCSLLDFILSADPKSIVQIATYATDSIDLFVQEIEGMAPGANDLEEKILTHPLMQKELVRQNMDLELLETAPLTEVSIKRLRDLADYDGLGNLRV